MVPKADLENNKNEENKLSFFAFIKNSIGEIVGVGGVNEEVVDECMKSLYNTFR